MKNLSNYCYKRDWKEAIVFYVVYFLIGIAVAGLLGAFSGVIFSIKSSEIMRQIGFVIGLIYSVILYIGICYQKRLYSFLYIFIGIVAVVINLFTGMAGSLIFVAFLTTRECNSLTGYLQANNTKKVVEDDDVSEKKI